MTELWKDLLDAWYNAPGSTHSQQSWEPVADRARTLLAKPMATREALKDFLLPHRGWDDSHVNAAWSALSHFAPPASNAPILRMNINDLISAFIARKNELPSNTRLTDFDIAAQVAYRLAQPVPEVDPDAEVKDWLSTPAGGEWLWAHMTAEQRRDAWRAVAAAAEKTNGNR